MRKVIGGIGFILIILGIGCMDSASIGIPAAMIAVGALLIMLSAKLEEKWEKE